MWRHQAVIIMSLGILLFHPSGPLAAQDEPDRRGLFLKLGAGVGVASGDNGLAPHESRVGPLASLQLGTGWRRVQLMLEAQWQPFKVPVPESEQSIRLMYYLGSLQVFLDRHVYLRGSLGVARLNWSGPNGSRSEGNPAVGLAAGFETRVFGRVLAFEGAWRRAMSLCFDECGFTGAKVLTFQVLVPLY